MAVVRGFVVCCCDEDGARDLRFVEGLEAGFAGERVGAERERASCGARKDSGEGEVVPGWVEAPVVIVLGGERSARSCASRALVRACSRSRARLRARAWWSSVRRAWMEEGVAAVLGRGCVMFCALP